MMKNPGSIDEKKIGEIDATEHIRMGDTIFRNVLETNEDGDVAIGLYSQGSWTPGWTRIYTFPNQQDYNDSTCENEADFVAEEEERFENWKMWHISDGTYFDDEEVWKMQRTHEDKQHLIDEIQKTLKVEITPTLAEEYMRQSKNKTVTQGKLMGRSGKDEWRVLRAGQHRADYSFSDWNVLRGMAETIYATRIKRSSSSGRASNPGAVIYALTSNDVRWIGGAAAVAGGGVTAWNEQDNAHILPEIIRDHTGRDYLGTMPGLSHPQIVPSWMVATIIAEAKKDLAMKKQSKYFLAEADTYIRPLEYRIAQISGWTNIAPASGRASNPKSSITVTGRLDVVCPGTKVGE